MCIGPETPALLSWTEVRPPPPAVAVCSTECEHTHQSKPTSQPRQMAEPGFEILYVAGFRGSAGG